MQLAGFVAGAALLGWCVSMAVKQGDWSRLSSAPPAAVVLLVSCTIISLLVNGTTFWVTIQPVRSLRWRDLMMLNLLANLLNYAPLRVGALTRIAYHLRVDRLPWLTIGAWFSCIAWLLVVGVGASAAATIGRPHLDWAWALALMAMFAAGGVFTRVFAGAPVFARLGPSAHRVLRSHTALWGALGLRAIDIAAYTGRMSAAMLIVGITIPASHVLLLALVAIIANLIPFGRLGFREMAVTLAAMRLSAMGMDAGALEQFKTDAGLWAQLALVESAGEAVVAIPAGLAAIPWFRSRWRQRAATNHAA